MELDDKFYAVRDELGHGNAPTNDQFTIKYKIALDKLDHDVILTIGDRELQVNWSRLIELGVLKNKE